MQQERKSGESNRHYYFDRRQKSRNVHQGLLNTPAMTSSEWKEAKYLLRHLYTSVAAHGLHHRICVSKGFHSPNERCQCTLCGGLCNLYHIIECTRRTLTLSYNSDDTNFQWYIILLYTVCLINHPHFHTYHITVIFVFHWIPENKY